MTMHLLNGRGYALTECGLVAARRDELTTNLEKMACPNCRAALIRRGTCPNCGEEELTWSAGPVKLNTVADGRLTMRDVETQFHLGCEECSETLIHSVGAEQVADYLTAQKWRP